MIIYSENIYTPEGVRKGYIEIEDKKYIVEYKIVIGKTENNTIEILK